MFFVRNLYIWIMIFALVIGGAFLFISSSIYQSGLESQLISSYSNRINTVSPVLSEMVNNQGNETTGADRFQKIADGLQGGALYFARILDTETGRIIAATDKKRVGDFYKDWVKFKEEGVLTQKKSIPVTGKEVVSLTRLVDGNELAVWATIDQTVIAQKTLLYFFKQLGLVLGVILILFVLFYFLEKRYLLKPMRELREAMKELGEDKFVYSEKDMPKSFG